MSFALKWEPDETQAGGFIYFDAVVAFSQSYKGSVTKHPISTGGNISDHFIRENPSFTLAVVMSSVDISNSPYNLMDEDGDQPFNTRKAPTAVSVNSTDQSSLTKYIPDSIGQFLSERTPDIVMDDARENTNQSVEELLTSLITGSGYNLITGLPQVTIREVTLYETDSVVLKKKLPTDTGSLVVTSVGFREDANTGRAVYCDLTLEQVTFVELKKTALPTDVRTRLKAKAASKKAINKCDGTVRDANDASNKDTEGNKTTVNDSVSDADPSKAARKEI